MGAENAALTKGAIDCEAVADVVHSIAVTSEVPTARADRSLSRYAPAENVPSFMISCNWRVACG